MNYTSALRWGKLLARYLASQGAIQALNLLTGFLILRHLSIAQYSLYIISMMFVTVAAILSDMGASHGVVTIGSLLRADNSKIESLLQSAVQIRKGFYYLAAVIVIVIAIAFFSKNPENVRTAAAVTILALAIAWSQQTGTVLTSVANIYHDNSTLAFANGTAAIARLCLVAVVCTAYPFALTALSINLVATTLAAHLLRFRIDARFSTVTSAPANYVRELRQFLFPLIPSVIYVLLQTHIATGLLWISGYTVAVAEFGALGRLGQIVGLIALLNGFFIQPYFSRIISQLLFTRRLVQVLVILILACGAITISALVLPDWWLLILGPNYSNLSEELRVAIYGAQLYVVGSIIYTITLARGETQKQWWQIVLGLGAQIIFMVANGVHSTYDALVLNLLPAATHILLQMFLLFRLIQHWK